MDLQNKQIVKLRNNTLGVVVTWGDKPSYIVASTFVNTLDRWNDKGLRGKTNDVVQSKYDIVKVYDGSNVEKPTDVFKSSFKVDELPVIWEAK